MTRPTIRIGSTGSHVVTVQECLEANPVDGDFGAITESAVMAFQGEQDLDVDGVVGPDTWAALESAFDLPPYPLPLPPPLDPTTARMIVHAAEKSMIGIYNWKDRGTAPMGYTNGMAIAYGTVVRKWLLEDSSAQEMAKANTRNPELDALAWYIGPLTDIGCRTDSDGLDTLRALFVLLWGLGMRESSGQFCAGRDQSADWTAPMDAEAGLFQMSWNMVSCSDEMQKLFDQFVDCDDSDQTNIDYFSEGVECSAADWETWGEGDGAVYQETAKNAPQFAVETAAVGLRNRRMHWGPINRLEVEVRREADDLLRRVEDIVIGADDRPAA